MDCIRILMFPWLAHGHISAFLELAKKLVERSFHIYFCSTPVNLNLIKPNISPKHSKSIQLVELHLPSFPHLPPRNHTTSGLPPHLMPTLKKAFNMATPTFSKMLQTLMPDLLIYDTLQPWAPALALSYNIPAVEFTSSSAARTCFVMHVTKYPASGTNIHEFPFPEIYLHEYEVTKCPCLIDDDDNDDLFSDKNVAKECYERSTNIVLMKTFREIEGKYIDYLSDLTEKKVISVGPLIRKSCTFEESNKTQLNEWLNKKESKSAVLVSFGTEYYLSKEEIEEMANGLELSKVNFIWVLRLPLGDQEIISIEDLLPKGFVERVGERGIVVDEWLPQTKILGHCSIGGFVSHCGWNSVMESMKYGVPIIAMPMHLDQPFNARLVVEVGAGLEISRSKNGRFKREEVAKVIKEVVVEKTGENIRSKAREISEQLRKKGEEEINEVVNELVKLSTR